MAIRLSWMSSGIAPSQEAGGTPWKRQGWDGRYGESEDRVKRPKSMGVSVVVCVSRDDPGWNSRHRARCRARLGHAGVMIGNSRISVMKKKNTG